MDWTPNKLYILGLKVWKYYEFCYIKSFVNLTPVSRIRKAYKCETWMNKSPCDLYLLNIYFLHECICYHFRINAKIEIKAISLSLVYWRYGLTCLSDFQMRQVQHIEEWWMEKCVHLHWSPYYERNFVLKTLTLS